jgi:hypothetical protein
VIECQQVNINKKIQFGYVSGIIFPDKKLIGKEMKFKFDLFENGEPFLVGKDGYDFGLVGKNKYCDSIRLEDDPITEKIYSIRQSSEIFSKQDNDNHQLIGPMSDKHYSLNMTNKHEETKTDTNKSNDWNISNLSFDTDSLSKKSKKNSSHNNPTCIEENKNSIKYLTEIETLRSDLCRVQIYANDDPNKSSYLSTDNGEFHADENYGELVENKSIGYFGMVNNFLFGNKKLSTDNSGAIRKRYVKKKINDSQSTQDNESNTSRLTDLDPKILESLMENDQ